MSRKIDNFISWSIEVCSEQCLFERMYQLGDISILEYYKKNFKKSLLLQTIYVHNTWITPIRCDLYYGFFT